MTQPSVSPSIEPGEVATSKRIYDMLLDKFRVKLASLGNAQARDGTGVRHSYGRRELESAASWPRVVWVRTRDTFEGATAFQDGQGKTHRPSATRVFGFDIFFHGKDLDQAEVMANDYITLLHAELGASLVILGGGEVDDSEESASWLRDGEAYVLSIGIKAPVLRSKNYVVLRDMTLYNCQNEIVR